MTHPKANPAVFFIDRLNLLSCLTLLPLVWSSGGLASINYFSATPSSLGLLSLWQRLGWKGEPVQVRLDYSAEYGSGGGLWYWVHATLFDLVPKLMARFETGGIYLDWISPKIPLARRRACFRQRLAMELYRPISIALFAEQNTPKGCRGIVGLALSDLFPLVVQELGCRIKAVDYLSLPEVRHWKWVWALAFIWEQSGELVRFSVAWLTKPKASKPVLPSIAVQCSRDLNGQWNDLWWLEKTNLARDRIIIYFDRGQKNPATNEMIAQLEQSGYRTVILDKLSNASTQPIQSFGATRLRYVIPDLVSGIKNFFAPRHPEAHAWQWVQWVSTLRGLRKIQAFMEQEHVKVIVDSSEFSTDCAALAADLVGGIKIGMHWSDVSLPLSNMVPIQQVYCVWGPRYVEIFQQAMGCVSESVLMLGNIFDQAEQKQACQIKSLAYRKKFQELGVKHVIGVFDRSCGFNSLIAPPYHRHFFESLLEWAETDRTVALILKHKEVGRPGLFRHTGGQALCERIRRLQQEGRLVSLDGKHPVLEAAYGSDLTISLGPNSAGTLCTLEGIRAIYWDPSGLNQGPFKTWANQAGWSSPLVMFDKMTELLAAVRLFLANPSPSNGLGNIFHRSPHTSHEIDCFRDGCTSDRLGGFVRTFIETLSAGSDRDQSLASACQHYAQHWGVDKIIVKEVRPLSAERRSLTLVEEAR